MMRDLIAWGLAGDLASSKAGSSSAVPCPEAFRGVSQALAAKVVAAAALAWPLSLSLTAAALMEWAADGRPVPPSVASPLPPSSWLLLAAAPSTLIVIVLVVSAPVMAALVDVTLVVGALVAAALVVAALAAAAAPVALVLAERRRLTQLRHPKTLVQSEEFPEQGVALRTLTHSGQPTLAVQAADVWAQGVSAYLAASER
jgi:hypothetical protein